MQADAAAATATAAAPPPAATAAAAPSKAPGGHGASKSEAKTAQGTTSMSGSSQQAGRGKSSTGAATTAASEGVRVLEGWRALDTLCRLHVLRAHGAVRSSNKQRSREVSEPLSVHGAQPLSTDAVCCAHCSWTIVATPAHLCTSCDLCVHLLYVPLRHAGAEAAGPIVVWQQVLQQDDLGTAKISAPALTESSRTAGQALESVGCVAFAPRALPMHPVSHIRLALTEAQHLQEQPAGSCVYKVVLHG